MTAERNNDIQRVLDATDLVRLIGEHVRLRPAGREFKGLCPFHDDKNPSLHVAPHKGLFKCFACGTGGDALRFVRLYHRMEFREALEFLAQQAGIELTPLRRRSSLGASGGEEGDGEMSGDGGGVSSGEIIEANRVALSFFRTLLRHERHGAAAREVLAQRHITEEMVQRFELGVVPASGDGEGVLWDGFVRTLRGRGTSLEPYEAAGLIQRRSAGDGHFDRFRNRLIFPIHDELGRPIAFGARRLNPDDNPKYLNSHEHARFNKSRTLYGMHLARESIRREKAAIIVEGYTDVIACHQHGMENAVATLGTSLTREHAQVLQRFCDRVELVFDGDLAGQKAADRAVEIFFESTVDVRVTVLPGGIDPADFLQREDGAEAWGDLLGRSVDALEFLFAALRREIAEHTAGVSARQRVIQAFLDRLGTLGFHEMRPLRRDLMLARLGEIVGMDRATLLRSIPRPRPRAGVGGSGVGAQHAQNEKREAEAPVAPARLGAESRIVACLLHEPRLLDQPSPEGAVLREALRAEWFASPLCRRLFEALACLDGAVQTARSLTAELKEEEKDFVAGWLIRLERETLDDAARIAEHLHEHVRGLAELVERAAYDAGRGVNEGTNLRGERSDDPSHVLSRILQLRARGGDRRRYARRGAAPPAGAAP